VLSYIFQNDVQILLVQVDLSGWFSLSVVTFSYIVGGWLFHLCSILCSERNIPYISRQIDVVIT